MCLCNHQLAPKARWKLVAGNLCLCAGIVVQRFARGFQAQRSGWIDFAQGFLFGMAIVFFYWVARQSHLDCVKSETDS